MTGYTPIYNLPYPQASDLVSAYPGTGQDLAEEVETVLAAKLASADYKPGLVLLASQSISSQSALNIDSVFSTTYDNYRVDVDVSSVSGGMTIYARLRASGSATTTGYYWSNDGYLNSSAAAVSNSSAGTATYWVIGYNAAGVSHGKYSFDIHSPKLAQMATYGGISHSYNLSLTQTGTIVIGGYLNDTTQYDGLGIACSSGTMTLTARIYGYRNTV